MRQHGVRKILTPDTQFLIFPDLTSSFKVFILVYTLNLRSTCWQNCKNGETVRD
jgi:hypothetical protein